MIMDACAWRAEYSSDFEYKIQVNNIKHGDKSTYNKLFKDWEEKVFGWSSTAEMRILSRKFKDEREWLEWAKSCPIKVVEIKHRSGKVKHIQHSCKTRKKRASKNV